MGAAQPPQPTAEGNLASRPFAHLLLYIMQQELDGTLAVWPDPDADGQVPRRQDRVRFRNGLPVAARLLEPASELDRGLLPLFRRKRAPFAFYAADLVGEGPQVVQGQADPVALVTASLRGGAREDRIDRVLLRLGDSTLRFRPRIPLQRFGFTSQEQAFVDRLRAEPATAGTLVDGWSEPKTARRLLYLLAITGCLEPIGQESQAGETTQGRPASTEAAARTSHAPSSQATPPSRPSAPPGGDASANTRGQPASRSNGTPAAGAEQASASHSSGRSSGRGSRPPRKPAEPEPPPDPPDELDPDTRKRWQEIVDRVVAIEKQTYFEMLDVERHVKSSEVQRAYVEQVKRWHPDRLPEALQPLQPWVQRVFHYLTEAKDTLTDENKRAEYIRSVQEGAGTPEAQRKVNTIIGAAMEFQKVEVFARKKAWDDALQLLDELLEVTDEEPDFHAMKAWLLLNKHGINDKGIVRQIFQYADSALQLNPRNERAHYTKGLTLKRQGKNDEALQCFRSVVEVNPKHLDASREVRLAEMRAQKANRSSAGNSLFPKLFGKKGKK